MSEIALLARAFDRVPEPDEATIAEARAALVQLIAATENGSFTAARRSRHWHSVFPRRASSRLRVAVVAIALLLLLAGIATATYLGVRTWVSSSPRGPQFKTGYRLATVFDTRVQGGFWSGWTLDPRGHDLYGLRWPDGDFTHSRLPKLMRVSGVDRGTRLHATRALDLRALAGPRFRPSPPGGPPGYPNYYWHQALTVAPNGDLFLLATGRDPASTVQLAGTDVALFVVHADGAHQRVLSVGELVQSRALSNARGGIVLGVVATAFDRLWLDAESWSRVRNCDPGLEKGHSPCHSYHFFQIVDPNADGDWSDRVVHPVVLPRVLSAAMAPWPGLQLAAEPPLLGDDRSRSVLAAMFWDRDKARAVYRLADWNGDGDARDPGEMQVVLAHHLIPTFVAPRVIRVHGVARREVVAAGLTRADRVSLVSASGEVADIARSFQGFTGVLAGPGGVIYPIGSTGNVYRLEPASAAPGGGAPVAGLPAQPPEATPTGGKAQLVLTTYHGTFSLGADGTGLRKLAHGAAGCFSADSRMMAYRSDAEAPHELFLYVAGADGSRPRKVSERDADPLCPFSTRWLLLISWQGEPTLIRNDLRTGHEVEVARNSWLPALSPDGTRLVYTGDSGGLTLVDLATLRHRPLAGSAAGRIPVSSGPMVSTALWSPDGKRIAYMTGAADVAPWGLCTGRCRYVVWVRNVADGSVLLRTSVRGAWPTLSWSPDGGSLLVCVKAHTGGRPSCSGPSIYTSAYRTPPARLFLVGISDPSVRLLTVGQLVFAGWAPSGETIAYATPKALFVRTGDGETKQLAASPAGGWPSNYDWLGWSPDGRYIGLGVHQSHVATVEVNSGRLRVLRPAAAARWWTR